MNLLPVFLVTGIIALVAAMAMVATRNMVYSVLYMVIIFLATAVIYILYQAPLIAMLQIAVYAGAIMVLFLFVVMLIGTAQMPHTENLRWQRPLAFILATILALEVIYLGVRQYPLFPSMSVSADFGGPLGMGLVMFKDYLLPFEIVSILLLVAMVGAIVLTVRKGR